jgi:osmoprotectant transport system permease protein
MISPLLLAQAGNALGCGPGPKHASTFSDALQLIFKERESISGGVCIGGLGEFGHLTLLHLRVSLLAIAVAIVIALPIGLWLGHIGRGEFLAVTVSNVGRAVPSLALLAFFVAFLGLGLLNVVAVLALLAIPPILTNTYVGVRQVSRETIDAARGQGYTESQIVRRVEFPLALPLIFAGLRTSAVAVVATATIAPLANVQTLGNPIIEPQTYGFAGQIAAAIAVALITLATDAGIGALGRALTPKGLKVAARPTGRRRFSLPFVNRTRTETT